MGTFDVSCSLTGLPIEEGVKALYGFAMRTHLPHEMRFVTPLYEGVYDGYGGFEACQGYTPNAEMVEHLKISSEAYRRHWRDPNAFALVCYRQDVLLKGFPLLGDGSLPVWESCAALVTAQMSSRQADLAAGDFAACLRPIFEPTTQEATLALGDPDISGAFQTEDQRNHAFTPPRHEPKTSCTGYELRDVYLRFMLESEAVYGVGFIPNVSGQGRHDHFVKAYNRRHQILTDLNLLTPVSCDDEA